jgi:hypothetical protein
MVVQETGTKKKAGKNIKLAEEKKKRAAASND